MFDCWLVVGMFVAGVTGIDLRTFCCVCLLLIMFVGLLWVCGLIEGVVLLFSCL